MEPVAAGGLVDGAPEEPVDPGPLHPALQGGQVQGHQVHPPQGQGGQPAGGRHHSPPRGHHPGEGDGCGGHCGAGWAGGGRGGQVEEEGGGESEEEQEEPAVLSCHFWPFREVGCPGDKGWRVWTEEGGRE